MIVLGIETSCDETSVAVVRDGTYVLSSVISSSQKLFANLAGVIPEEAARKQVECMMPVLQCALDASQLNASAIKLMAVTKGPGLLGSLLVGTTTARVLADAWDIPLIGVHHTLGHLSSTWLAPKDIEPPNCQFPLLTLSASGGHTELWYRESHTKGLLLGRTRDDAAGEAFDKGASMLDLPYPGGPSISKEAEGGDPSRFPFPKPLHDEATFDFSYSGLKTALRYTLRDNPEARSSRKDLAASYQHAICTQLLHRISQAIHRFPHIREVHLVGGVSANQYLRTLCAEEAALAGITLRSPLTLSYCTDNAAMIAAAGYFSAQEQPTFVHRPFETVASLSMEDAAISAARTEE